MSARSSHQQESVYDVAAPLHRQRLRPPQRTFSIDFFGAVFFTVRDLSLGFRSFITSLIILLPFQNTGVFPQLSGWPLGSVLEKN